MAGAVLGLLQHKLQAAQVAERLLHPLGLVAHHQEAPLGFELVAAGQHPLHQGGAS